MNADLSNAATAALESKIAYFGRYQAKFNRVWRDGDVIAYVNNGKLIPSQLATVEEKVVISSVDSSDGSDEQADNASGDAGEANTDKPVDDVPADDQAGSDQAMVDMPVLQIGESLIESRDSTDLQEIQCNIELEVVQTEGMDHIEEINGAERLYEAVSFEVFLNVRRGEGGKPSRDATLSVFDYMVWSGSQLPTQEVLEKTIGDELKYRCEFIYIGVNSLSNFCRRLFVRMDAACRNLPKSPKAVEESVSVLGKIKAALKE